MMTRYHFTVEEHAAEEGEPNKMTKLQMELRAPPTEANLIQLEKNMLAHLHKEMPELSAVHIFDYKVLA